MSDARTSRKKWSQDKNDIIMTPRRHERVPVAKQMEPSPGYDEYLLLLQQRNQMLQKVKLTDKDQIEKERKEKGFALYVNGANDPKAKKNMRRKNPSPSPRSTNNARLAADISKLSRKTPSSEESLSIQIPSSARSRSAPDKSQKSARKNWNASSINIQTARGEKMHLHAPDNITGNYTEDFEDMTVTDSLDNSKLDNDSDDDTIRESIHDPGVSKAAGKVGTTKPIEYESSEDENEEISDHVVLTLKDVSKLRKSLELSKLVRESISQDTDDSDFDEEINEVTSSKDMLSAGDTLTLEFAPLRSNKTPIPTSQRSASTQSHINRKRDVRNSKSKGVTRNGITGGSIDFKPPLASHSRTPRPLSSVKRASVDSTTESVEQKSAVLSALAKENEQVSEYKKSMQKSLSQSRIGNPLMNSFMVNNDDDMKGIEDRVLQMEPKQQRDLIKTLYKLENTVRPSSTAVTAKHNRTKSKDTEVHKVLLEFLSNWGHDSAIGLTEIAVLDECNSKIEVKTSFLRLDGARNCNGHESNLFNNRFRTVKERNMFCCERSGQRPVSLSFRVEIPLGSQISKIKFWNYNRSLAELSIGVRRLRISIDDDIMFDGDIEKGCGNQVFDYGYTVVVGNDDEEDEVPPSGNMNSANHEEKPVGPASRDSTPRQSVARSQEVNTSKVMSSKESKNSTKPPRDFKEKVRTSGSLRESNEVRKSKQKSPHKRLHHPDHTAVRKSGGTRQSSEMWIPLSGTPEPLERCQTRILNRSTDGVNIPGVDSDPEPEQAIETYNDITQKQMPKSISLHQDISCAPNPKTDPVRQSVTNKPPLPHNKKASDISKTTSTAKPLNSTQSKLPWMENLSLSQKPTSPVAGASTSEEPSEDGRNSRSKLLSQWVETNKSDPLRSSLDDMLEALDMWKPENDKNSAKEPALKTIFDDPAPAPKQSDGIPTQVASEKEELNYRRTASREMAHGERRRVDKESPRASRREAAAARRKKWQQPSVDLEASWTSLDAFAKSHKGRLSMEGDALDEYLRGVGTPGTGITVDGTQSGGPESNVTNPALEAISEESDTFIIPELPAGQNLTINIKSTWGDKYYVGLNGIELFADNGEPISITKITANPRDINMLSDYNNDPRVVSNLADGVNKTRDDIHMWLAPFTEGGNHFICLTFTQSARIALMRIWNYNKSRIHSYRGAKQVEVSLDGHYIFKGEIARACGGTQGGTEAFGDTILFTTSEEILDAVSRHDGQYEGGNFSDEWEDDVPYDARPATADKGDSDRPHTSVATQLQQQKGSVHHSISTPDKPSRQQPKANDGEMTAQPISVDGSTLVYSARRITLNFTETWGDTHYLGLTGFEVVSKDGEAIPITLDMLHADPRDLHILPGYQTDDRTLDKVIDGDNITISDEHMWLIPYTEGADHLLTVTFSQPEEIVGLRFWNYNKSAEDTYRGAKTVHILLDDCPISPPQGFLIRKGPGSCHYDFAQELLFSDILRHVQLDSQLSSRISHDTGPTDETDDYIISGNMPKGFVYQLHLLSTQSDLYYIGLNAIEFFDSEGKKIQLDENNLAAYPESVNVLDGISGDVRTPDKLINGENDTNNGDHMWLAPILPGITNRLFVIFDYPQTVSMIKIWNYSKTPSRGVKDFALLVDDLVVYNGALGPVQYGKGIVPGSQGPQNFHTILFTNDAKIKNKVKHTIVSNKTEELDIQLTNDNLVVSKPLTKLQQSADQALRPKTSVQKRPGGRRR